MIEPVMYFGIGFLVAALLGLLFVPLVHNRAVRLTMRRLEAATPLSIAEIRADKDQLRAEFAMSTRRLEMSVAQMKTKTTSQLAELGKKADAINQLKKELGEKTATIFALEARDKTQREQLRTTEEEFQIKNGALREVERTLADKEAELVKLVAELGEHSITSDSQRVELAALRTQVEAMKVSVTDYERTVKDIELRRNRERSESEATAAELATARLRRRPQLHRFRQVPLRYQAARSAARARGRRAQQAAARACDHEARRGINLGVRAGRECAVARAHQRRRRRGRPPHRGARRSGLDHRLDARRRRARREPRRRPRCRIRRRH
jgi:chromosome segregation ATPase